MSIPPALAKYIATRDRRIMKENPIAFTPPLAEKFDELQKTGTVTVGGRATCGSHVDQTWKTFAAWNEVVKKARSLGIDIQETPVKHGNGWATKAGGFWDERVYTLGTPAASPI